MNIGGKLLTYQKKDIKQKKQVFDTHFNTTAKNKNYESNQIKQDAK